MGKIQVIKAEAVVDISIGTEYYRRIQELFTYLLKDKTKEEYEAALNSIKENNITEEWVKHIETILIFCSEYEKMILDQKLTEELDV